MVLKIRQKNWIVKPNGEGYNRLDEDEVESGFHFDHFSQMQILRKCWIRCEGDEEYGTSSVGDRERMFAPPHEGLQACLRCGRGFRKG